jgi:hypothetical protein
MPRSHKWSLPFKFSNQNTVCTSHLSHAYHIPCLSHPPWSYHSNNIWWSIQVVKLFIMQSSPDPHHFLSTLFSNTLNLCSLLNVREQVSHPYKTTHKIMVMYILI